MNCPKCNRKTSVLESRMTIANEVRRRRQCYKCGHRITTIEAEKGARSRPVLEDSDGVVGE